MQQNWKGWDIAALLGLVIPGVLLSVAVCLMDQPPEKTNVTEPEPVLQSEPGEKLWIPVIDENQQVISLELEDYLTGVLLAEIPADFEPEAKKAQAVVARTYALRANERRAKHGEAALCMDASCCQGYCSKNEFLAQGGTEETIEQAQAAVVATQGEVLLYDGELIEATYFSCSGGSTEDAVAVWGTDVPYLKATSSPGEERATHYTDIVSLPLQEFEASLGISVTPGDGGWIGDIWYTSGGGVKTIEIGGVVFEGTALRKLLNLSSTAFQITYADGMVTITTRGFGHRVGMSQYGADAMAAAGKDYRQILAHYYQGTEVKTLAN